MPLMIVWLSINDDDDEDGDECNGDDAYDND